MSEEEMIKIIKQIIEFTEDICIYETENKTMKEVLNYIDKLQKENEELKNKNASLKKEIKLMKSININDNFISKDTVRNKIKELEVKGNTGNGNIYNTEILILQELLESDIE